MTSRLDEKELEQRGNVLKVKFYFSFNGSGNNKSTTNSREYLINGSNLFQVQVKYFSFYTYLQTFVKFTKKRPDDNLTYRNYLSSVTFKIENKHFVSDEQGDEENWHIVNENNCLYFNFDIAIRMDIVPSVSCSVALHGDTDLTDFELRGEDGSVRVHRAILAASSPVFRTMLGGAWKETKEGCVEVPGTSVATLQHLKDFIYQHTLPESGVEQLLLLASCYSMPELEKICVYKLMDNLTAQNVIEMLDFASKHRIMRLFAGIFESVKADVLKVDEILDHIMHEQPK